MQQKNKPTLNEIVKYSLGLTPNDKISMLGIGPMSHTLIKASMLLAKKEDFPLMFIASRNQVDADELGGGYVCGWNQKRFADALKNIAEETGFTGLYYLCRDHGGPWQRDNERNAHLPEKEAMELAKKSYLHDLKNGFDLLHIDPTKDPYTVGKIVPMELVLNRTVELIEFVENERLALNLPPVSYEVGTEETNGGLTSNEKYETFVKILNERLEDKKLPRPAFIVGNTGTLTRLTENVGHVDLKSCQQLAQVAEKYDVGLKEHNGDYLFDELLLQHPALGVTAMNVAPEFGTIETLAYLSLIEAEKGFMKQGIIKDTSNLEKILCEKAVLSGRWKKWLLDEKSNLSTEEILKDQKLTRSITEISGHYTFNDELVRKETATLYNNLKSCGIDAQAYVIYKLQAALKRYVKCFNLSGFTTKLN